MDFFITVVDKVRADKKNCHVRVILRISQYFYGSATLRKRLLEDIYSFFMPLGIIQYHAKFQCGWSYRSWDENYLVKEPKFLDKCLSGCFPCSDVLNHILE